MLPLHRLCLNCDLIITDSGPQPLYCNRCDGQDWPYFGYKGEYNQDDVNSYLDEARVEFTLRNLK